MVDGCCTNNFRGTHNTSLTTHASNALQSLQSQLLCLKVYILLQGFYQSCIAAAISRSTRD